MRYRFFALGMMSVAAAVWMACSGDDRTDATSIGGEGQACLPGDQCIAGFICVGGKCITSAFGGAKGDGGSATSGNPAATPADCEDISTNTQPLCPTPDAGDALCTNQDRFCCPGVGCMNGNLACEAPEGKFECFGSSQCGAVNNGRCCLTATPQPGGCQATTVTPTVGSVCTGSGDTSCDPGALELCSSDSDCPPNAPCTKTQLSFKGVDGTDYVKTIGYCNVPVPVDAGDTSQMH